MNDDLALDYLFSTANGACSPQDMASFTPSEAFWYELNVRLSRLSGPELEPQTFPAIERMLNVVQYFPKMREVLFHWLCSEYRSLTQTEHGSSATSESLLQCLLRLSIVEQQAGEIHERHVWIKVLDFFQSELSAHALLSECLCLIHADAELQLQSPPSARHSSRVLHELLDWSLKLFSSNAYAWMNSRKLGSLDDVIAIMSELDDWIAFYAHLLPLAYAQEGGQEAASEPHRHPMHRFGVGLQIFWTWLAYFGLLYDRWQSSEWRAGLVAMARWSPPLLLSLTPAYIVLKDETNAVKKRAKKELASWLPSALLADISLLECLYLIVVCHITGTKLSTPTWLSTAPTDLQAYLYHYYCCRSASQGSGYDLGVRVSRLLMMSVAMAEESISPQRKKIELFLLIELLGIVDEAVSFIRLLMLNEAYLLADAWLVRALLKAVDRVYEASQWPPCQSTVARMREAHAIVWHYSDDPRIRAHLLKETSLIVKEMLVVALKSSPMIMDHELCALLSQGRHSPESTRLVLEGLQAASPPCHIGPYETAGATSIANVDLTSSLSVDACIAAWHGSLAEAGECNELRLSSVVAWAHSIRTGWRLVLKRHVSLLCAALETDPFLKRPTALDPLARTEDQGSRTPIQNLKLLLAYVGERAIYEACQIRHAAAESQLIEIEVISMAQEMLESSKGLLEAATEEALLRFGMRLLQACSRPFDAQACWLKKTLVQRGARIERVRRELEADNAKRQRSMGRSSLHYDAPWDIHSASSSDDSDHSMVLPMKEGREGWCRSVIKAHAAFFDNAKKRDEESVLLEESGLLLSDMVTRSQMLERLSFDQLLGGYSKDLWRLAGPILPIVALRLIRHAPSAVELNSAASGRAGKGAALTTAPVSTSQSILSYALESLAACPFERLIFYIPQIVQLLRRDSGASIARWILAMAAASPIYAHQIIWNMQANMFTEDDKPDSLKPEFDSIIAHILDGPGKEAAERQFRFFKNVTDISGSLKSLIKASKTEKKTRIDAELKKVQLEEGCYLPTDPESIVIDIDYTSGRPLQSHAKAPFMATFKISDQSWKSVIFKVGDDCRQDMLALQLISVFKTIYDTAGLPLYLHPYRVIATAPGCGVIQVIPNSISRDQLGREKINSLYDYFVFKFGPEKTSPAFHEARSCFIKSLAAYSIVSYLLAIRDRHNGNIMIDDRGHIIHIDFGFILDIAPGGFKFERAPFKLTLEMIQLLGGSSTTSYFAYFKELCTAAFLAARPYAHRIVSLAELMVSSGLPCFKSGEASIHRFMARFRLDLNGTEAAAHVADLIFKSYNNTTTKIYDSFQYRTNAIPY